MTREANAEQFAAAVAQAIAARGLEPLKVEANPVGLAVQYRRPGSLELRSHQVDMGKLCNRLGASVQDLLPAVVNEILEHAEKQSEGPAQVPPGGCPWCGLSLEEGDVETKVVPSANGGTIVREHVACAAVRVRVESMEHPPTCEACGKALEPRPRGRGKPQPGVMWCPVCNGGYRV